MLLENVPIYLMSIKYILSISRHKSNEAKRSKKSWTEKATLTHGAMVNATCSEQLILHPQGW